VHVLLAVAERRLELRVGRVAAGLYGLLHARARVLMVVERGRRRALRVADLLVALEVVRQRREADREVVAVAEPHAHGPVGGVRQRTEARAAAVAAALPVVPEARERVAALPPRLLLIVGSAVVACQLPDDLVLVGAPRRPLELGELHLEVVDPPPRGVRLIGEVDAAARLAQRLREQEVLIA